MSKKSLIAVTAISVCVASSLSFSQDEYALDNEQKKYSYAIGNKIGQQLMQQFNQAGSDLDIEAFRRGIDIILSGQVPQISDAEADQIIQQQQQAQVEQAAKLVEERKARASAYLEKNKNTEGVTVTDSGIQYKKITQGADDGESPTLEDTVVVHYQGTLIDGAVFDSSYERGEPATFPLGGIIEGWKEVLQLMKPGDKWSVVIPSELAYGERGAGGLIGPNETLLFDIELIEVKKSQN